MSADNSGNGERGEWALLTTTSNTMESKSAEALLVSAGIPVYRKPKGLGGYLEVYTGFTSRGVDIFVPNDRLTQAQELLEAYTTAEFGEDMPEFEDEMPEDEALEWALDEEPSNPQAAGPSGWKIIRLLFGWGVILFLLFQIVMWLLIFLKIIPS